jgi:hypothetical protein
MIYTFGDSHSVEGWNCIPEYLISKNPIGPILMYSIGNDIQGTSSSPPGLCEAFWNFGTCPRGENCELPHGYGGGHQDILKRLNLKSYPIKSGDIVVFCFGEIDCRCNIAKHVTSENTYQNIIDTMVDKYLKSVKLNVSQFDSIITMIYNVVPPVSIFNTVVDEKYPFLGTDDERKHYVTYLNSKLKEKCPEYGFVFIDIYDKYACINGFLNKDLSDGHVHIRDGKYIKDFMFNYLENIFQNVL